MKLSFAPQSEVMGAEEDGVGYLEVTMAKPNKLSGGGRESVIGPSRSWKDVEEEPDDQGDEEDESASVEEDEEDDDFFDSDALPRAMTFAEREANQEGPLSARDQNKDQVMGKSSSRPKMSTRKTRIQTMRV
eukprot:CAMPEP_0114438706 /NCGR_PEP_ID=MMETSP0103-20121206/14772_1 /TAXON_ID=37642 ORGANISM="Paraphysomonas imperforata, Strain PA2" /NCGR_SAMPLE_ID=MMETSP0103 /ASSEMBLY_ACC=CAM_ASM_000201 /LENGTH=131 /DNA_ID=CAMNT_0001609347 /DNA_START=96 /DNA_END=487 /DNA_ORIENTATION=+